MSDARVKRVVFHVSHTIDVLGRAGSDDVNASGVAFDLDMISGSINPHIDKVDIRNVAVTSPVENTYRVNFFHQATRGGVSGYDSTYLGGFDIPCVSGVPENQGTGIYYGNAHNQVYGQGVTCYIPYFEDDVNIHRADRPTSGHMIHGTIQNIGSQVAAPVKVMVLYEVANDQEKW